jgi:hypothetical protein
MFHKAFEPPPEFLNWVIVVGGVLRQIGQSWSLAMLYQCAESENQSDEIFDPGRAVNV